MADADREREMEAAVAAIRAGLTTRWDAMRTRLARAQARLRDLADIAEATEAEWAPWASVAQLQMSEIRMEALFLPLLQEVRGLRRDVAAMSEALAGGLR